MKRFLLSFLILVACAFPAYAVEVDLQWPKGTQFFDDAGSVLDSGTINIYDAGTTSLRTTYSDSGGTTANTYNGSNQIVLGTDGRLDESVYIPVGSWKFVIKDSGGTTLVSEDNLEGAHATSTFLTGSVAWTLPVLSKSSDYTITSSDYGKCINANPTGASFTVTLTSAATAGDGKTVCVRHVGTANEITIATVSSQTIDGKINTVLSNQYDSVLLISDGANWHIAARADPLGREVIQITDRLTAPPASPTAGACYILNGTGTGDWSGFDQHDVLCANGSGSWLEFDPREPWLAYVTDEALLVQYRGSSWMDLDNITAPQSSVLGLFVAVDSKADGSNAAASASSTWTTHELTATETANITGASLASNQITLPAGNYFVNAEMTIGDGASQRIRFVDTNNGHAINGVNTISPVANNAQEMSSLSGFVTVTQAEVDSGDNVFELQYYMTGAGTLGVANSEGGSSEYYARVSILDMSSLQGSQGAQGAQGATGATGYPGHAFTFDTDTDTASDSDAGDLRLSSATLSAVTTIMVDDADSNSVDISADVLTWDDQTSSIRGTVTLRSEATASDLAVYDITGASVDNSGWTNLTVTAVTSNGTFAEDENVRFSFARTGDKGDTGSTGATGAAGPTLAVAWTYSATTTDSDPGSGIFRLNNATPSSATQAYFDNNEIGGTDVSAFLDTWDDNGTTGDRGTLVLTDATDSTVFYTYTVTGSVTDGTGYRKVSLTYVAGSGTLAGEVHALFVPRGTTGSGDVTGAGSSVDSEIVLFSGAGGDTLKSATATGIVVGNSGVITAGRTVTASSSAGEEGITITNGSGVSGNPTVGLDITGLTADTDLATTDTIPHYDGTNNKKVTVDNLFKRTETFIIPAGALITAITNGAAISTSSIGAYGSAQTIPTAAFDASTQEEAVFAFSMPDSWDQSTITASEIHWTAASGSGTVGWGISCGAVADSGAITTSIFGTEQFHVDTLITAYDNHVISSTTAITVANAAASTLIVCRVRNDVNESLAVDALLLSVTFEYGVNARSD